MVRDNNVLTVVDLIDNANREWRREVITDTFSDVDAAKILRIPLAKEPHEDVMTTSKGFYRKLQSLNLPSKIKITIWRISKNFIPTLSNMYYKRLVANAICPRCGGGVEMTDHVFRSCPASKDVWKLVGNKRVHENSAKPGREVANFIQSYIKELEGIEERGLTRGVISAKLEPPSGVCIKINFDADFDWAHSRSRSVIHANVGAAFAAEALSRLWAVQTGLDLGFTDMIIEGDSLSVIKKSNSDSQDKSEISAYTRNIKRNINSFRSLRIKHARRSANQLAHVIATESLRNGEEFYLEEKVPRFVVRIMEEEWIRARLRRKMVKALRSLG
ncbi:hypothetical protein Gotri_024576 [Gossypium trilobum]|uniref:Reverse transcriptase n=1 Tax=Gossypium trilobum TaxID=34281 RepID=A0A7J9DMR9_9ROSI|nr:hypothetical protein [Gossypium trilobum]